MVPHFLYPNLNSRVAEAGFLVDYSIVSRMEKFLQAVTVLRNGSLGEPCFVCAARGEERPSCIRSLK